MLQTLHSLDIIVICGLLESDLHLLLIELISSNMVSMMRISTSPTRLICLAHEGTTLLAQCVRLEHVSISPTSFALLATFVGPGFLPLILL